MATYVTTAPSRKSVEQAFQYMIDVEHFTEWDPGISRVLKVSGNPGEVGATYDITIAGARPTVMRYAVTAVDAPRSFRMESTTRWLRSLDEIRVVADGSGSRVTYDARLDLRGPLRLFDPVLGVIFRRIGDRAAAGLRRVLA